MMCRVVSTPAGAIHNNPNHVATMLHVHSDNPWKALEMLGSMSHKMQHEKAPSSYSERALTVCVS